jgi:chondroitin synthase
MPRGILSIQDANEFFCQGSYREALDCYLKISANRGWSSMLQANIDLCRRRLGEDIVNDDLVKGSEDSIGRSELDPATRYMMAKMGRLPLTDEEMLACIEEHARLTSRKSEDAEVKPVNPVPANWPKDLILEPLPESTNDFDWNRRRNSKVSKKACHNLGLSVIVPTFNRTKILDITLACLANQKTGYLFEVIVADDGSKEQIIEVVQRYESLLDIKCVRQKDYGYQLCAVRNLGLRTAKFDYVAILDCDMAPNPSWVEAYMTLLEQDDDVALIGPRKYVDTGNFKSSDFLENPDLIVSLPDVHAKEDLGRKIKDGLAIDWRIDHFRNTEDLRLCDTPFRYFSGGNVAFARKWLTKAGWFDEEFTHWGGEDNEFGYRLYRYGCFFRAVWGAIAYHQEPPGKENETDRAEGKSITNGIVQEKVPYFYRKITSLKSARLHNKPLVSIYIPAHNCADHIVRCVDSALNQPVVDLEVCICNDGSTDDTLAVLTRYYGHNPRVRVITQPNGGIGRASNAAVRMARGYYIGQLDSDDFLEPDAVELCLKEFFRDRRLVCVYTSYNNINESMGSIRPGYNYPEFSRETFATSMIVHHFRMFTSRAWCLAKGFDEQTKNAIDYDYYLKVSEVGLLKHINRRCYNRRLHNRNTSLVNEREQKSNALKALRALFARQNVCSHYVSAPPHRGLSSREVIIHKKNILNRVFDNIYVINLNNEWRKKISCVEQFKSKSIIFNIWPAVNGLDEDVVSDYQKYSAKKPGQLKHFRQFNHIELKRGSLFINSPGAFGYIRTYLNILKDADLNQYDNILIMDDDFILSDDSTIKRLHYLINYAEIGIYCSLGHPNIRGRI